MFATSFSNLLEESLAFIGGQSVFEKEHGAASPVSESGEAIREMLIQFIHDACPCPSTLR